MRMCITSGCFFASGLTLHYNLLSTDGQYELVFSDVRESFVDVPPGLDGDVQLVASAQDNVGNRRNLEEEEIVNVTVTASAGAEITWPIN